MVTHYKHISILGIAWCMHNTKLVTILFTIDTRKLDELAPRKNIYYNTDKEKILISEFQQNHFMRQQS